MPEPKKPMKMSPSDSQIPMQPEAYIPRDPEGCPPSGGERLHWLWRSKLLETGNCQLPVWKYLSEQERDAWEFVDIMRQRNNGGTE